MILIHCNPSDATGLWTTFAADLSDDFLPVESRINNSLDHAVTAAQKAALKAINSILHENNLDLLQFITLPQHLLGFNSVNIELDPDHDLPTGNSVYTKASLNQGQLSIFHSVVSAIQNKDLSVPKMFFVDGPGGTGKSH